jgi:hypothetical protein
MPEGGPGIPSRAPLRGLGSCIDPLQSRYVARPSSCPLWRAKSLDLGACLAMVRTASSAASLIPEGSASGLSLTSCLISLSSPCSMASGSSLVPVRHCTILLIWPGDRNSDPFSISSSNSRLSASIFSSSAARRSRIERILSWRVVVSPGVRESLVVSMSALIRASSLRNAAAAASCASCAPPAPAVLPGSTVAPRSCPPAGGQLPPVTPAPACSPVALWQTAFLCPSSPCFLPSACVYHTTLVLLLLTANTLWSLPNVVVPLR